ncbi:MAG: two-component regulator propeller domain-containing protein [Acidobacteriota bacterium]
MANPRSDRGSRTHALRCLLLVAAITGWACEVTYTAGDDQPVAGDGPLGLMPIETVNSETMAVTEGPDGSLWVVTKYDVVRFPKGDLTHRQVVLDPQIFQQQLGAPMDALSAGVVASDGVLWLGSWEGEVFRQHQGRWLRYITKDHGFNGKVSGIVLNDRADRMWMGAYEALWEAVKEGNTLDFVIEDRIEDVAMGADGSVAAATFDTVYRYADGEAEVLWRRAENDGLIASVSRRGTGWLVGTQDGWFHLEPTGAVSERQMAGRWVMSALDHPSGLVVGAWRSGLWFEVDGAFHPLGSAQGLPGDKVYDLHVDRDERLWIGLYDGGPWVGDLAALRETARTLAGS